MIRVREAGAADLDALGELGSRSSVLSPVWYAGAFALGAASGVLGDRWALGFVEETERQVSEHWSEHLEKLPKTDARSRAIVSQMRDEEESHGANAKAAGAAELTGPANDRNRLVPTILTRTPYLL